MIANLAVMALGLLIAIESLRMPAATLEPLGPRAFPLWLSLALILLAVVGIGRKYLAAGPDRSTDDAATVQTSRETGGIAAVLYVAVMTAFYVLSIEYHLIGFSIATAIYLFAVMAWFSKRSLLEIAAMAIFAVLFGLIVEFIFTNILFIDIASVWSHLLVALV